ncbi:hypothetical protein Y032_0025g1267 [Ancylostoma ceylanicum]|nr:hypothetical protein Y032_0025g1267 [Ancylostoma ceylanicum]
MYKMEWDCQFEKDAQSMANVCGMSTWLGPASNRIAWSAGSNIAPSAVDGYITNTFNYWMQAVKQQGAGNVYNNSALSSFANVAFSKITKIGCGYKACGGSLYINCVYSANGGYTGTVLWENGSACQKNQDCTLYKDSKCEGGLCIAPKDAKLAVGGTNKICPKNENLNDKARQNLVDTHNRLRSTLGKGLAKDPLGTNGIAPKAARMLKMIYDCEIEYNAQKHADTCVFKHSPSSERPGLGENLWMSGATKYGVDLAAVSASESWWSELKQNGVGPSNILTDALWNRPHKMIGHYTQMAWQNSYKLGCGIKWCPSMTYVVCQYGPAGNWMGSIIYDIGNPCTTDADCKCKGCKCSQEEALCIMPE